MTRTKVASELGVSRSAYQRWEEGALVPPATLTSLAALFKSTEERLLGVNSPIRAAFYDDRAPAEHQFYGEVSFHFVGGGKPLVLSISEKARSDFIEAMARKSCFVPIRSLSNQLVAIRRDAIADIYFCSDAYDDFGPEHLTYEKPSLLHFPDNRDWEIIESIVNDFGKGGYDRGSVNSLERVIHGRPEEEIEKDLAEGRMTTEQLEELRQQIFRTADEAERLACCCVYQISSGKRRNLAIAAGRNIYDAFNDLYSGQYQPATDGIRYVEDTKYIHFLYLNLASLDFVSVPAQKFIQGMAEVEGDEDDEDVPLAEGDKAELCKVSD